MQARNSDVVSLLSLAVDRADGPRDFLLVGTTDTDESFSTRATLRGAEGRGGRAIIAVPDCSYLSHFYDPASGDVILDPSMHARRCRTIG